MALHESFLNTLKRVFGQQLQYADVLPRAGVLAVTLFQPSANVVEDRR